MTVTVLFEFLRWLVIIALAGFLCWMIYRLLSLFLREMGAPEAGPNAANNPPIRDDARKKTGIWIESNWGGLGGGLSGWRASNAATYLLLICLLLGCLVVAIFSLVKPQEQGSQKQEQYQQKKDETAEQKGSIGRKADQEKAGMVTDEKSAEKKNDENGADKKNEAQPSGQKSGGSGSTDAQHSEKNQQKSPSDKKEQH